jgi:hypothetical protein
VLGEDDLEERGAPVGVLLAEGLSLEEDRVGGVAGAGGRGAVEGGRPDAAVVQAAAAEQVLDGAQGEAQLQGEGVAVAALQVGPPEGVPDGLSNGARHGWLLGDPWPVNALPPTLSRAKPGVRIKRTTHCPVTGPLALRTEVLAIRRRRQADQALERAAEVALVGEAGGEGHLGQ